MPPTTGDRLAEARRNAGLTLDDVLVEVRTRLPESMWISRATIARVEKLDRVDPFVVATLAESYRSATRQPRR